MKKKVKIGVIGCSNIAQRLIIPNINDSLHYELIIIGSSDSIKCKHISEKYNCQCGSYLDVLNNKDVEAVYVSLPNSLHYYWGKEVLKSGKHLFLEKPFTTKIEETIELLKFAKSSKLIAKETISYLYSPFLSQIKNLVRTEIGSIKLITANFGIPNLDSKDIRYSKELGGGAILDMLIYPLTFALDYMGEIEEISSKIKFHNKYKIDTEGYIHINNKEINAYLNFGIGLSYNNSITIWGVNGILSASRIFSRPKDFENKIQIEKKGLLEYVDVPKSNQYSAMLDHFYELIETNNIEIDENIIKRNGFITNIYNKAYSDSSNWE
jgi:predicted dehydrogenase